MRPPTLLNPTWRTLLLLATTSTILTLLYTYTSTWGSTTSPTGIIPPYLKSQISNIPSLDLDFHSLSLTNLRTKLHQGIKTLSNPSPPVIKDGKHPIDTLISRAQKAQARVLASQPSSVQDAAKKYREARSRHPPPYFDTWYAYASSTGSLIPESFFDQIYHDLRPFWSVNPYTLRSQSRWLKPRICIRNGEVTKIGGEGNERVDRWVDMLSTLSRVKGVVLPDVEIPVNGNEEPAVVVPWEVIDTAVSFVRNILVGVSNVQSSFTPLPSTEVGSGEDMGKGGEGEEDIGFKPEWMGARLTHPASKMGPRPYWTLVQPACAPGSPARVEEIMTDVWHPQGHTSVDHEAVNILPQTFPRGSFGGFVANWTDASDVCGFSYLQGLHGGFVGPEEMSVSEKLFVLFGAGKFAVGNEVLVPGAREWNMTDSPLEEDGRTEMKWEDREEKLFWRGPATGGRYKESNWPRFHRHRFVSMMNTSHVRGAERSSDGNETVRGVAPAGTFRLPETDPYHLLARSKGHLADWVEDWSDVAFTTDNLHCEDPAADGSCPYTSPYFSVAKEPSGNETEKYKYMAVIDGNGGDDGGELVHSLKNGGVTLRASVYRQWYDARLRPWIHYVPMDNTFMDAWGIMEYFVGRPKQDTHPVARHADPDSGIDGSAPENVLASMSSNGKREGGHDAKAKRIAEEGKKWADKVLRREDMLIFLYRLLLEYARVVDDSRERLGWVGDLDEGER